MKSFLALYPSRGPLVAQETGTKLVYLRQIANGHRMPGHKLANAISKATDYIVTVHDLRPDIYGPAPGIPPEIPAPPGIPAERAA